MPMRIRLIAFAAVLAAAVALRPGPARGDEPADDPKAETPAAATPAAGAEAAKEDWVPVTKGALATTVKVEGTLDAAERVAVRVRMQAFGGPLEVLEVVPAGKRVAAGDVLIRFETKKINDEIRNNTEELEAAKFSLSATVEERTLETAASKERLERAEFDRDMAVLALDDFQKRSGARMLKIAELSRRGRENILEDAKEELFQLEDMYKKSELAGATKDIVLHRAQRSVKVDEDWLAIEKGDEKYTIDHEHPDQLKNLTLDRKHKVAGFEREQASARIAAARRDVEVKKSEQAVRNGDEGLAKLTADRESLVVKAPAAGLVSFHEIKAGDHAQADTVLFEIVATDRWIVKTQLDAGDLRVVAAGAAATVMPLGLPEIALKGSLAELSESGTGDSPQGVKFPGRITIAANDPLVRAGMKCEVTLQGRELAGVLSIPRKAVTVKDGKSFCKVSLGGDKSEEREITTGSGNDDAVQVIKGLTEQDKVAVEKK